MAGPTEVERAGFVAPGPRSSLIVAPTHVLEPEVPLANVEALKVIYAEEVGHVAYGSKWFHFLCGRHDIDPKDEFHRLVRRYFHRALKPPFNEEKRAEAGLPPDFYWPLADDAGR